MLRIHVPFALLALGLASLPAQTVTLTSSEVLRIHFTIPSPPSPSPDVLQFGLGLVTVLSPYSTRTARLWDGGTLLGTAVSPSFGSYTGLLSLGVCNSWRQVGSLWSFDNPGDVQSFAPLQNATIQGIIDFELGAGAITLDLANVSMMLVQATGSGGGSVASPAPVVLESVVVPKQSDPSPGSAGAVNTWTVTGCGPGSIVVHVLGLSCAPVLFPATPPVFFDLAPPNVLFASIADPSGVAALSLNVPPAFSGVTLFVQSAEVLWPAFRISSFSAFAFP